MRRQTLLPITVLALLLASCAAGGGPGQNEGAGPQGKRLTSPLVLKDRQGASHDVHALLGQGRSVVLVFWQTWCETCRDEGPELAAAATRLGSRMSFFGVVSGPDEETGLLEMDEVSAELGLSYPQVRDVNGVLAERFGVVATPTILVFGPDGALRYRGSHAPERWESYVGG